MNASQSPPRLPPTTHALDQQAERTPIAVSTFSGPGGSSLGYKRAGFDVRAALDCAPGKFGNQILDTYRANHDGTLIEQDARETSGETLLDAAGVDRRDLDLLDGSPPCSPFSTSNSEIDWTDHDSGTLFDHYARLVDETNPRVFVAENVPGLKEGKTKGYFQDLVAQLRAAGDEGYRVRTQVIDAASLGASQHRRRLMFMGTRKDLAPAPAIQPTSAPTTIAERFKPLDIDPERKRTRREHLRESQNYAAYKKLDPGENLADLVDKGWSHYRLDWHEPAPTFVTAVKILPPHEDRQLTIPETKRAIGIPVDYEIPENAYSRAWECCIRCLPPELLDTIARTLRAHTIDPAHRDDDVDVAGVPHDDGTDTRGETP